METQEQKAMEIYEFLTRINQDLDNFIVKTIQEGSGVNPEWSKLFKDKTKPRCWESLSCDKTECPVRHTDNYRCWLIAGTLCEGKVQGKFAQKFGTCTKCEIYKMYHETPVRALYENINILINHLTGEAQEFHRKAITDRMTRLYNRAYFDEIIQREIAVSQRNKTEIALMLIDMDGLKIINDTSGHILGDTYIKTLARILEGTIRSSEYVFRIGGDEFVVLLLDAKQNSISHCEQRIREQVNEWNMQRDSDTPHLLSVSIGTTKLSEHNHDPQTSIKIADERMYEEKRKKHSQRKSGE